MATTELENTEVYRVIHKLTSSWNLSVKLTTWPDRFPSAEIAEAAARGRGVVFMHGSYHVVPESGLDAALERLNTR